MLVLVKAVTSLGVDVCLRWEHTWRPNIFPPCFTPNTAGGGVVRCQAEALEWGAEGYQQVVGRLATKRPELVLAGGHIASSAR